MKRRIYVASSWRNAYQPDIVKELRSEGHEVYDFRNPQPGSNGFSWRQISPDWESWTAPEMIKGLDHELARHGFGLDWDAMNWSDTVVLVTPCGRSAHLELGWGVGAGRKTAVLMLEDQEPELMYKMVDLLTPSLEELLWWLG